MSEFVCRKCGQTGEKMPGRQVCRPCHQAKVNDYQRRRFESFYPPEPCGWNSELSGEYLKKKFTQEISA